MVGEVFVATFYHSNFVLQEIYWKLSGKLGNIVLWSLSDSAIILHFVNTYIEGLEPY